MKHLFWGAAASALVGFVFVTGSCGSESQDHVLQGSKPSEQKPAGASRWKTLDAEDNHGWVAKAIGVLGEATPCSATLVQLDDDLSKKAKLLTAGHCVEDLLSSNWNGKRVVNQLPYEQDFVLATLDSEETIALKTEKVIYGSIVPYDIAVLTMEKSYAELLNRGFRFAQLAKGMPAFPKKVWNIAYPTNGAAVISAGKAHIQKCRLLETVAVKEYLWLWEESFALDCVTEKGSSGSPLFVVKGDQVQIFGIINTKSAQNPLLKAQEKIAAEYNGAKVIEGPCGIDNPCVVGGAEKIKGMSEYFANFGQPVYMLAQCYIEESESFDTEGDCGLGEVDRSEPVLGELGILREDGLFILSFLTQDDEGSASPAGIVELELSIDGFPSSVPFRYSLETSEELSFDGEYVHLEFDIGKLLFSFGLDTSKQTTGSIRVRVGDESENWSDWASPMLFSFQSHDS